MFESEAISFPSALTVEECRKRLFDAEIDSEITQVDSQDYRFSEFRFRGSTYIYRASSYYARYSGNRINFAFARLDFLPAQRVTTVTLTFPHVEAWPAAILLISAIGWASIALLTFTNTFRLLLILFSLAATAAGFSIQIASDRYQIVDWLKALLGDPEEVAEKSHRSGTQKQSVPSQGGPLDVGDAMGRMDTESAGIETSIRKGFLAIILLFIGNLIFQWIIQSRAMSR